MQQILDAILAGDTTDEDYASLELPESYPPTPPVDGESCLTAWRWGNSTC